MTRNNHGMALIVTLSVMAVILTGILELSRLVKISAVRAHKAQELFLAGEKAMSGIHLGMALLVQDAENSELDSIQEDWAIEANQAQAVGYLGFSPEDLVIGIEDEMGKIQMNALIKKYPGHEIDPGQRLIWLRFLDLNMVKDETQPSRDPEGIVNCAIDWLDSNDNDAITGLSGAEMLDYSSGSVPYGCANAPFNHPYEFFSLKGVEPEIFEDGLLTVRKFFTVYGLDENRTEPLKFSFSGRININTAGAEVLASLLPTGMDFKVQDLIDFREQKAVAGQTFINTLDKGWYEKVIDLSEEEKKDFERIISYTSDLFSITSTGRENKTNVRLRAVVKRESKEGWGCRIIQLEREL